MFPPVIMKDVEANTFDVKAWEEQAYHPSGAKFVPHKVELAGQIIKVIQKPDGVVILAEEHPIGERPMSGSTNIEQEDAPWFAITFKGTVESRMFQAGNRLIAVGTTSQARAEMLGGAPRMLPHLRAQCLHVWNTEGVKNMYAYFEDFVEAYSPEERTVCREDSAAGSMFSGSQGNVKKVSGGQ
jgi:starvation-inducible outer membrane lipoprotein